MPPNTVRNLPQTIPPDPPTNGMSILRIPSPNEFHAMPATSATSSLPATVERPPFQTTSASASAIPQLARELLAMGQTALFAQLIPLPSHVLPMAAGPRTFRGSHWLHHCCCCCCC